MNKYAGIINVIDDEGNIVYERELSQEAIIAELLLSTPKRIEADDKPPVIIEPEVLTRSHTRPPVDTGPTMPPVPVASAPNKKGQKLCKACGQPGHMQKTCPKALEAGALAAHASSAMADAVEESGGSRDVVNMSPMSKANFEVLKEMQLEESEASHIASEIGWTDMEDLEVALKSNSYLSYTFDRKKVLAKRLRP